MSYIIDTDILSLIGRKQVPAKLSAWLEGKTGLHISVVTLAEQEFGLEQAPASHREDLSVFLGAIRARFRESTKPLDLPVLMRWKQLLADLKKNKRTMSCEDSLIAATALHHGYVVVTRNERHFTPSGVAQFNPLA